MTVAVTTAHGRVHVHTEASTFLHDVTSGALHLLDDGRAIVAIYATGQWSSARITNEPTPATDHNTNQPQPRLTRWDRGPKL